MESKNSAFIVEKIMKILHYYDVIIPTQGHMNIYEKHYYANNICFFITNGF